MAKKHEKLGLDVSIRECSVLDSFEVSSDNEYESGEELIKSKSAEEHPEYWDPMPLDSKGQEKYSHLVHLSDNSPEYRNVKRNFNETMSGRYTIIVNMQRLQIPVLYQQYAVRKREIEKRNPKGHQNERWLWHGTSPDTLAKINTARGFDRNFAGKNGKLFYSL